MMRKQILVVDDQLGIRKLLEEVLTEQGYEVRLAANGLEALARVEESMPELIFMDMKMPGMDGIEALREFKKIGVSEKVIMMTAYGELELVNEAKALGALDYITKPFDIMAVAEKAKKYFSIHKVS